MEGELQAMRRRNEKHQQNIDQMTTALHFEKASAIEALRQLESKLLKQHEYRRTIKTKLRETERDLEKAELKADQDEVDLTSSKAECKRLERELQMFVEDDPRVVSMHSQHREIETRAY